MKIHNFPQNSPEWDKERCGRVTSSEFEKLLAKSRDKNSEFGAGAWTYALEIAAERDTGTSRTVESSYMKWGKEHEPGGISLYESVSGNFVTPVGFISEGEFLGCSPDGMIGKNIIEVKCPENPANQERIFMDREVPKKHIAQVQGNIWLSQADYCDFISFDPRMPEKKKIVILKVERDDDYIEILAEKVERFEQLIKQIVE